MEPIKTVKLNEKCVICNRTKKEELEYIFVPDVVAAYDENSNTPLASIPDIEPDMFESELVGGLYYGWVYICSRCQDAIVSLMMMERSWVREVLRDVAIEAIHDTLNHAAREISKANPQEMVVVNSSGKPPRLICKCGEWMVKVNGGYRCNTCGMSLTWSRE